MTEKREAILGDRFEPLFTIDRCSDGIMMAITAEGLQFRDNGSAILCDNDLGELLERIAEGFEPASDLTKIAMDWD